MTRFATMVMLAAAAWPASAVDWEGWFARYLNDEVDYGQLENLDMTNTFDTFDSAQTYYLKGLVALRAGDEDRAESDLSRADRMLSGVSLSGDTEGLRLLADVRAQLMLLKGLGYIIRNARSVETLALEALEVDPANARAAAIVAQGKINSPRAFGGDVNEAFRLLAPFESNGTLSDTERFVVHWTLAAAEMKKNNNRAARRHVEAALELFPNCPEAITLLAEL